MVCDINVFQIAAQPGSSESLQQLIERLKNQSNISSAKEEKANQAKDEKVASIASQEEYNIAEPSEPEPDGFHDQVRPASIT